MRDEEPALGVLCVYGVCADGFCKIEMGSRLYSWLAFAAFAVEIFLLIGKREEKSPAAIIFAFASHHPALRATLSQ